MELAGIQVPQMNWDGINLPENWKKFKQHAELVFSGPLADKSEEVKCSYLLIWCGEKGRDIYKTWTLTDENRKLLKTYYDKFESHVEPKANPVFARYKFHNKIQSQVETVEQFVTELKLLAKDCEFKDQDEMIRDRIVFGTNSHKIREKLINKGKDLTLDKAIEIARTHELSSCQLKSMKSADEAVHGVRKGRFKKSKPKAAEPSQQKLYNCGKCGRNHEKDSCPAKGQTCHKCKKLNHFSKVCKTKLSKVHEVNSNSENENLYVETITNNADKVPNQVFVKICVGEEQKAIEFKLDTGAQVNVLPTHVWEHLKQQDLLNTNQKLFGYGGKPLNVKGKCVLTCVHNQLTQQLEFFVVTTQAPPVLSLASCLSLKLIKLVLSVEEIQQVPKNIVENPQNILKEFDDIFSGLGLLPEEHDIKLKPEIDPVIHPPRKVPVALRDKLKCELNRMEEMGVIIKVDQPTDWVNSLVIVEKPRTGDLRICLDPRDLNQAIKREHYQLPTLDEITPMLAGAKYFSVLDARSGYWQIKLSEKSSMLTTFNTPFGRYRFTRMPFGIHSAQEIFQKKMDLAYEGLADCKAIIDDILVWGSSIEEHDNNLRNVLQRSREKGIKLNPDKCVIRATQVSYFGHTLSEHGVQPDPKKLAAINEMAPPKNKQELETVLGMVNYLAKFTPGLAEITSPMRDLMKKDSEFVWDCAQDASFRKMKELISSAGTLAFYDVSKEVTLEVDASKHGLGAVLLQEDKPVAYASKSLTCTEQNYAQIEKEMYAILFGAERFHQYIYGRHVKVITDHKPLEAILKKPLSAAPPRLQRMMLRLQKYDLSVSHKPGKEIPVADTLSRLHLDQHDSTEEAFETQVHMVMTNLPISDQKLAEVKIATQSDQTMQQLIKIIQAGWPDHSKGCPASVRSFWNHRDELSVMHDLVFKGERIVIPTSLRSEMLKRIHAGHMGIEKCRLRAKELMFWPGMCAQIAETVSRCAICLENRGSNAKEPMINHELPSRPWQNIASDLFQFANANYLIVVDYYSRYFEFEKMLSTTSSAVITKLKAMFARHGIPEKFISDNGPQYDSQEFKQFTKDWDFQHVTSSPVYPQSNGLAEKAVHIAKQMLKKAQAEGKDPYTSLLEYRNTPIDNLASPAQLLMSRRLRSIFATTNDHLKPCVVDIDLAQEKFFHKQNKQKKFYDVGAKQLKPIVVGERIRVQTKQNNWKPATVINKEGTPRSYTVRTDEGGEYRRNRRHLLKTGETANEPEIADDEDESGTSADNKLKNTLENCDSQQQTHSSHMKSSDVQPYSTRSGRQIRPPKKLDL